MRRWWNKLCEVFRRGRAPVVEPVVAAPSPLDARVGEVQREVGEVLTCTEQATLSVGGSLDRIVADAQAFIGDMRARLAQLDANDRGGVGETLTRQCEAVTAFVAELREAVTVQRQGAERMLSTSRKVAEAAQSVTDISTASRILCLNTMIEAARLGDAGQPMIVIADHMRTLSEQINRSNGEITSAIEALLPILDDVNQGTKRIEDRAATFAGEFADQARDVEGIAADLQNTAELALRDGDEKIDAILGSSRTAIESLQTQDLVSQRLRRVLQLVDPARGDEAAGDATPDTYLSDVMHLDGERELEAGEFELF